MIWFLPFFGLFYIYSLFFIVELDIYYEKYYSDLSLRTVFGVTLLILNELLFETVLNDYLLPNYSEFPLFINILYINI